MDYMQSPQDFVRALKAASNPPLAGGPLKFDIAREAWDNVSFYVPNKAEIIGDWILTRLLREKDKDLKFNPILDGKFWILLAEVISSKDISSPLIARPVKSWLMSSLNRIPIAPILVALLKSLPSIDSKRCKELNAPVLQSFLILWPVAVPKLNTETLLECFGAMLGVLDKCNSDENLAQICLVIVSSLRTSLINASNKRKVYLVFIQTHMQSWIQCMVTLPPSGSLKTLLEAVYATGIEIIFSLEVLRQVQDKKSELSLLNATEKFPTESFEFVLRILPRVFVSFVQCIRKHRSAIFSQTPNQVPSMVEEVRATGMKFFNSCQLLLERGGSSELSWSIRVALLTELERESLFSPSELSAEHSLKQNVEAAIIILETAWRPDQPQLTKFAIGTLSALMRIDNNLIVPTLAHLLPKLLFVQGSGAQDAAQSFLGLLLDYYTKTRSLPLYVSSLLDSLSPPHIAAYSEDLLDAYQVSFSGPLVNPAHLERLARSAHNFLTASQVIPFTSSLLQTLKNDWEMFHAARKDDDNGRNTQKKRKDHTTSSGVANADTLAIVFSLSSTICSAVLSALPFQSVPVNVQDELRRLFAEVHTSVIHPSLNNTFRKISKGVNTDMWASHILAAAALRLQYTLSITHHFQAQIPFDSKLSAKMTDAIANETVLPELLLEMSRILFFQIEKGDLIEPQTVIDKLLGYLVLNFRSSGITWYGLSCQLTFSDTGKKMAALAILHMILERWLPIMDVVASRGQLKQLIHLIAGANLDDNNSLMLIDRVEGSVLLIQALRSANFWELPNLRNALLSYIDEETSSLEGFSPKTGPFEASHLRRAVSAFNLLLFFPIESIPRNSRADFVKRALVADVCIDLTLSNENDRVRSFTIIRILLKRLCTQSTPAEISAQAVCDSVQHMLSPKTRPVLFPSQYISATLDLVDAYLTTSFKISDRTHILTLMNFFKHSDISVPGLIIRLGFMRLIDVLTREFLPSDFAEDIQVALKEFQEHLVATFLPLVSTIPPNEIFVQSPDQIEGYHVWCQLLSFRFWLKVHDSNVPRLGHDLLARLISSHKSSHIIESNSIWEDTAVAVLAILSEEHRTYPESHRSSNLDIIVAAYVSLTQMLDLDAGWTKFDTHISKTCKYIALTDFSHVLDFILEGLMSERHSAQERACLLRLSILLLHNAPQGTLKTIQIFVTTLLGLFADRTAFTQGPIFLRLGVLGFIARHCSDRPAALRISDLGSMFSVLSQYLAKSHQHDDLTSTSTFHEIVSIVSSLIRLRRDLVLSMLPHLGMILGQLMSCIRSPRPQLGGKQTKLVADTLPRWINVAQPLGPEEGKTLARLLETLTTKSVVRTHILSSDAPKPESLAKPFSKHALHVVKAYIDAMNDPLCILPLELRKELYPGLFSLCDMLSEHSRDAMMVSALEAGGKTIMKALWNEYEKQKYVGKG